MAIDLGDKRIGVALTDAARIVATGHTVIQRSSKLADFAAYQAIIDQYEVQLIVMGLPVPLNGVEGQRAAWVRKYTKEMCRHIEVPVEFWDESMTTIQAERSLRARGKKGKKVKERVDAVAAAFILQSYLDAHRPLDDFFTEELL